MAQKNVALTITFVCWNTSTNTYATGETWNGSTGTLALHTIGDGTLSPTLTAVVTELDATNTPGLYSITIAQANMNYNQICFGGKSSTANVVVIPRAIDTNANMTQINGALTSGNNATLSLAGLSIVAQAAATPAVTITGNTSSPGRKIPD